MDDMQVRGFPIETQHYTLTRDHVFEAVYRGIPIDTDEEQYPQVRQWLTECREFWDSEGRGLISFIAQNEIKRLDQLFDVTERQA